MKIKLIWAEAWAESAKKSVAIKCTIFFLILLNEEDQKIQIYENQMKEFAWFTELLVIKI